MDSSLLKRKSQIEVMSPAGSFEAIKAAIAAGAGSVYFGVGEMNMRAAMKVSFSVEDLPKIAEMCDKHGVRSYLTLNIVIYDEELDEAKALVDKAKESGISAVIACDLAVLTYCRETGMPSHISTQANVSNIEEVEFFSEFADTMVLGRELNLEQIANIAREIDERQIRGPSGELVRIEIFVHGYFCMAISGKCYLSLDRYGTSANRGDCKVNCKRQYILKDARDDTELLVDDEHLLSARDLCTIDFIDRILESGASVLKIEGRKKGSDYVHVTTKCYREAVDACFDGTYTREKINYWRMELSTVFNRGFWSGYYLGRELDGEEWSGDPASKVITKKDLVAEAIGYVEEEERAKFKVVDDKVKEGEDLLIVDPEAGVIEKKAEAIRVDGEEVKVAREGDRFSLPVPEKLTESARIYRIEYQKDNPYVSFGCRVLKGLIGSKAYHALRNFATNRAD